MADKKKVVKQNEQENKAKEINLDELDKVTGGSSDTAPRTSIKRNGSRRTRLVRVF